MSIATETWVSKSLPPEHDDDPASPESDTLNSQLSTINSPEEALIPLPDLALEQSKPAKGIPLTATIVTEKTEHLPEDQRKLLRYLHHVARDKKWDWKMVEAETRISGNALYRILTDKYRYPLTVKDKTTGEMVPAPRAGQRIPLDQLMHRLRRWKALHEARLPLEAAGGFVKTSVYRRMDWLFGRCLLRRCIGMAFGDGQIGKTTAAKERLRLHNHGATKYFEIPPGGTANMFLAAFARALNASISSDWEKLLNNCVDAVDCSMQIIIDEVSRIFTIYDPKHRAKILDAVRFVHDQKHVSIVFIATDVFRDKIHSEELRQFFKQFTRRDHYELQLPAVAPREDLDLFAAQYGLAPAKGKAEEYMWRIATKDGLGKYVIRLQDAVEIAANAKQKVTWAHFEQAHTMALKNLGFDPLNPNQPSIGSATVGKRAA